MTAISTKGKRAFIFNPTRYPCYIDFDNSTYHFVDSDCLRNSEIDEDIKQALLLTLEGK